MTGRASSLIDSTFVGKSKASSTQVKPASQPSLTLLGIINTSLSQVKQKTSHELDNRKKPVSISKDLQSRPRYPRQWPWQSSYRKQPWYRLREQQSRDWLRGRLSRRSDRAFPSCLTRAVLRPSHRTNREYSGYGCRHMSNSHNPHYQRPPRSEYPAEYSPRIASARIGCARPVGMNSPPLILITFAPCSAAIRRARARSSCEQARLLEQPRRAILVNRDNQPFTSRCNALDRTARAMLPKNQGSDLGSVQCGQSVNVRCNRHHHLNELQVRAGERGVRCINWTIKHSNLDPRIALRQIPEIT